MSIESENTSSETDLVIASDGPVRVITLNRPHRRNALSTKLIQTLSEALLDADASDDVRAIVLSGAGEHAFCSGLDLKEMREQDQAGTRYRPPISGANRSLYEIAVDMKKPTVAALNGSAVAGGFELALACDLRISHAGAMFGLPEAKIGMGAHFGSVVLARRIPLCFALEMLFTGELIPAERAQQLGLLNRLVRPDEVMAVSMDLALRIAQNAPLSVRRMKAMALRGLDLPMSAALRLDIGPSPYESDDREEGVRAWREGRAPVFRGR